MVKVAKELEAKLKAVSERQRGTLADLMEISFLEFSKERVVASMEVSKKVQQPFGLLHGGASVVLAETLASIGGWLQVDESKYAVVGLEINANHIRATRGGIVTGTATPIHLGRKTNVWEIKITNQDDALVCISRCTLAIVPLEELVGK